MSVNTRSPFRSLGAVQLSGQINDGATAWTQGGQKTFSAFSGGLVTLGSGTAGVLVANPGTGHAVIASGPGRINAIITHQLPTAATTQITFYDSNVVGLSGVASYQLSGLTVVGMVPGIGLASIPASGVSLAATSLFNPAGIVGLPFYNGLSVSAASGAQGFTVSWTPSNESYQGGP
jgi:hypothetical protein